VSNTAGQAILAMIESDLASVAGGPLETLFGQLKASAGNILAQQAAWIQFIATAPAAGIQLEVLVEQQILNALMTKIQSYIAAKVPPAPVGGVSG
jgi:hypothetical protein